MTMTTIESNVLVGVHGLALRVWAEEVTVALRVRAIEMAGHRTLGTGVNGINDCLSIDE